MHCALPKEFTGLSWNVDFNVPLMNRMFHVYELEDESHFIMDGEEMFLVYCDDLESDIAASEISINPKTTDITPISSFETGNIIPLYIDETGIELEDIELIHGVLEEGIFKIEIIDPRPEIEEMEIICYDILDQEGQPFQVRITDFTTSVYSFDLSGFSIGDVENDQVLDYLEFFVQTTSEEFFYDLLYLRIFFDEPLYFSYFRGYLENKRIRLNDTILANDINFPINISNAFQFDEGTLELTFSNELGFDTQFIGTITGVNEKDQKIYALYITEEDLVVFYRAVGIDTPTTTTVSITKPEVTDLINIFPEEMLIEESYFILGNSDQMPGFALASDKNSGSFTLKTPSIFSVSNETVVPDSIYTLEITETNRDYIEKYTEMVYLNITLENTIPVGLSIDIYFSEVSDTLFIFNPDIYPEIHSIKFAENYVSGAVNDSEPTKNEIDFLLERQEIELFLNETIYYAFKITFDESIGTVTVLPDNYLRLISKLGINLNVDLDM
ncbi:MAG: hypothetical protein K0B81_04655 [Candidatus Cloacimonetes bacterium]|nr:hypothetical protein [Candidatus Cloacimonadota bacterium]